MEILVHVSAPSSARDDARYRAQVAAIRAFEPISRQPLIADAGVTLEALPPADGPGYAENAEPAASSFLLQAPELISAPSSVPRQAVDDANASAAIAGQPNGVGQTSSDSRCDRDLMHQRKKKPLGNPQSPPAHDRPLSDPPVTATPIANSNPSPCPRRDRQSILPGPDPEANQIRPSHLVSALAPGNPISEAEHQSGLEAQPRSRLAPDSLESIISVIPDSQPELAVYAERPCPPVPQDSPPLHEEDQPDHPPKRRRVGPYPPSPAGQTITKAAEIESTITSCSTHHEKEKALPGHADKSSRPPLTHLHSHSHTRPSPSPFPSHVPNPASASASADAAVWVTETEQQQHQKQPPIRNDLSFHHQNTPFSKSLPLSLRPPPPPISTSTFKTHITPTLAMLTERLKPARTYKPIHQSRELDTLERGYWAMRVNIAPTESTPAQEETERGTSEGDSGADLSPTPQTWTEPQFTHFWTFLSNFIAKDARAGWGVWCIAEHVDPEPGTNSPNATANKTTTTTAAAAAADNTPIAALIKVYAWGEVSMHIYLMLYLASERRVRGMGLKWVDSWEEVVIQMP
ncbi:uncharacterized protein N7496_012397 [Penicillium cataractarum]|uniref:Acetamidase n=1 Tax=Penicillium cataractarum TaxID=2100454 RepID=A0A9W9R8Z8_9EURO|nr:uncharacterized protein N7496_012397 [Penicillium cataractarum]KAJ5355185.1 hypothetical protein N7496_012397 [Penicillium cataractarum]